MWGGLGGSGVGVHTGQRTLSVAEVATLSGNEEKELLGRGHLSPAQRRRTPLPPEKKDVFLWGAQLGDHSQSSFYYPAPGTAPSTTAVASDAEIFFFLKGLKWVKGTLDKRAEGPEPRCGAPKTAAAGREAA